MPIQIGQRPARGFDEPLGLLSDCHRRIEHFLHVLATVADEAAGGALSPHDRTALEGALTYFAVAAPKHTADEESSLFPRLRHSTAPEIAATLAALEALERDHDEADAHHAAVERLGRRWVSEGRLQPDEAVALREHLARLRALYERHIAIEDQGVFPAAARVLGDAQLAEIGREMAARRR